MVGGIEAHRSAPFRQAGTIQVHSLGLSDPDGHRKNILHHAASLLQCLLLRLDLALLTGLCCVSSYSVTRVSQAFMGWETHSVSDFQLGQPHGNSGPANDKVCPTPAGPGRRERKTRKDLKSRGFAASRLGVRSFTFLLWS